MTGSGKLLLLFAFAQVASGVGALGRGSETLYNGIQLPTAWPPPDLKLSREPRPVPYLVAPPAVIPIDVGRQLFIDDFLIEQSSLLRTFHRPVPYDGNPILEPDRAWEKGPVGEMAFPFSDGVWFDPKDQLFKMWYMASEHAAPRGRGPEEGMVTCYAVSKDGLHWTKPSLDVVPGTNIVLAASRDCAVVWLDLQETVPARRFKLLRSHPAADKTWGMSLHYSADGIHWSGVAASSHGHKWVGDRNSAFFNPFRNVWVYSIRNSGRHPQLGRIRYYSESSDLAAGLAAWSQIPWTGADGLDPHHPKYPEVEPQLYNLDAVAYESVMLGFFSIWQGPDNKVAAQLKIQKRNEILVGFSRDGFNWDRPDRRPFLGVNETEGAWNWGNVQSVGGGCLVVGDKLYFYYSGRRRNDATWDSSCRTGVAMLRRDGFASMEAETAGTLTTRPVVFKGRHLFVNADIRAGELRVEVLDREGNVIAPFSAANCTPLGADSTKQRVQWAGTENLAALANQQVRFRFILKRGQLFSFWVSGDASGVSSGYVAAGGPGFAGAQDQR